MRSLIRLCILVSWLSTTTFAWADTSNTAPTFTLSDGKVTTSFGAGVQSIPYSVSLQADGKILVAGSSGNGSLFALARYSTDGILDSSFGTEGKVTTSFANSLGMSLSATAYRVTVQADGKAVVAGTAGGAFALARYNTDGSLDFSFGTGGKAPASFSVSSAVAYGITVQTDGKILVAGSVNNGNYFAVARHNADGSLDTGFGSGGKVVTPIGASGNGDYAYSVTVQTDGKILVAGESSRQFALVRYTADGILDASFGTSGKVTTAFDAYSGQQDAKGYSVALQADGNIVVAGTYLGISYALARYKTDGSLDAGFGVGGMVTPRPNGWSSSSYRLEMKGLAIQTDGRILVSGNGVGNNSNKLALARFNTDGSLDTSFDLDGMVEISSNFASYGGSVVVQPDGKILTTGQSYSDFTLLRYNANGTPDNTFAAPKNTLSASPILTESTSASCCAVLDPYVQIYDAELSAANNYDGATLTLSRHNGASADDVFSSTGTLSALIGGSYFAVENLTIGRVIKNDSGTLTLSFNSNATQSLVSKTMQRISYGNASNAPPATVQIDWIFSDGNTGAQGIGGSLSVVGSTIVNISATNDAPVVSVPLPDIFVKPNTALNYIVPSDTFVDPDGNPLMLSVVMANGTGMPPWLTFTPATKTLGGTPTDADIGAISINIKATDNSGASVTNTVLLTINNKDAQTLSFGTAPTMVAGGTGTVSASASSGLAASFKSTTPKVCTISGSMLTGVAAGTCTIVATQLGDAHYNPAPQATQSITVASNTGTALNMLPSWNLMGNGVDASIDVATVFNDASKLSTVWKWVPATSRWAFYTPTLGDGGAAYAASKGYDFLTAINGGEGFWVNAKAAFTVLLPSQVAIQSSSFMPALASPVTPGGARALPPGWSLIATGDNPTPSWFDGAIATGLVAPPMAGQVYGNFTTLWTWDAVKANWYFWAPSLFNNGTLANYIVSKSYLEFSTMPSLPAGTLSPTTGFWVNMP